MAPVELAPPGRGGERRSGVLLHITSLPSKHGVGDLGPEAHLFISDLAAADQAYWQMLPVGPTGYGDSPYQSWSSFAANPMLISLDRLVELGLLAPAEIEPLESAPAGAVDYAAVIGAKTEALERAALAFRDQAAPGLVEAYSEFRDRHGPQWLDDAAVFAAVKAASGGAAFTEWPAGLARRDEDELGPAAESLKDEIEAFKILQFLFFEQWRALRRAADAAGVRLVGDLPLYVAHDSADVWARPEEFLLDAARRPTVVAGVPPDYFSPTGQRWGAPIYDWDRMQENGFSWWRGRTAHILSMFDVVRIDHFRGIAGYWAIPAEEETAVKGEWLEGPGSALLDAIGVEDGDKRIIAEDLGVVTEDVEALRDGYGLPGMRVAQFGFDGAPDTSLHHPRAFTPRVWAYTGTHDNNTTEGWFWAPSPRRVASKLGAGRRKLLAAVGEPVSWGLVEMVAASAATTTVFPAQDLLGLGAEARMNTPGTAEGAWRWRLRPGELDDETLERLALTTRRTGRSREERR